jgi:hypothetical protein
MVRAKTSAASASWLLITWAYTRRVIDGSAPTAAPVSGTSRRTGREPKSPAGRAASGGDVASWVC